MRENTIKVFFSAAAAVMLSYFRVMAVPIAVLLGCMVLDYISGLAAAWYTGCVNSKIGKHGAIKKVCYMLLVIVAGVIDWLLYSGLVSVGVDYVQNYLLGLIVSVWLILNELISILENCVKIGVPVPRFLKPIAERLKIFTEKEGEVLGNQDGNKM